MTEWLLYIFFTSCFFAVADVINDINITNMVHEGEKEKVKPKSEDEITLDNKPIKVIDDSDLKISKEIKEINATQDVFIASCLSVIEIFIFYFIKIELSVFDIDFSGPTAHSSNYTNFNTTLDTFPVSSFLYRKLQMSLENTYMSC
jgi:hypothetical protein